MLDHVGYIADKMEKLGIIGVCLGWFRCYLKNKTQNVRCNVYLSKLGLFRHGIPQGSIMGPILYLLYVNDLYNGDFIGNIIGFADDTSLML